jgi:hypothetical protein
MREYIPDISECCSSEHVLEFDIIKIKIKGKVVFKLSYFNKIIGEKKGFILYEYKNERIEEHLIDSNLLSNSFSIELYSDKIGNVVRIDNSKLYCYNYKNTSLLFSDIINYDIEYGCVNENNYEDEIDDKIILNINNNNYKTQIKCIYKNFEIEDEEVEPYYNYCCNGQGD